MGGLLGLPMVRFGPDQPGCPDGSGTGGKTASCRDSTPPRTYPRTYPPPDSVSVATHGAGGGGGGRRGRKTRVVTKGGKDEIKTV